MNLTITCLRYTLQATTMPHLGAHAGAQIRGGMYNILREMMHPPYVRINDPRHMETCPVCRLMSYEDQTAERGKDRPRPFGILPPPPYVQPQTFNTGDSFTIGIHLYGDPTLNFQQVSLAIQQLGERGVGMGRGQFRLQNIEAINPLTNASEVLSMGGAAKLPELAVTQTDIDQVAATLSDSITLDYFTPLRLIEKSRLVKRLRFAPFILRLIDRLEALEQEYAGGAAWKEQYLHAKSLADDIQVTHQQMAWKELVSGSRRTNTTTPISGLVGEATFEGDLSPFHQYLIWGTLTQLGKDVVKGNGWYRIQ